MKLKKLTFSKSTFFDIKSGHVIIMILRQISDFYVHFSNLKFKSQLISKKVIQIAMLKSYYMKNITS